MHSSNRIRRTTRATAIARCGGFSLLELMSVVAIISVLASVTGPALMSLASGRSVATGLNVMASMMAQARQSAISGGQPVALVITEADAADPAATQAMVLLSAAGTDSTGAMQWKPKCIWNRLPQNVLAEAFERGGAPSFFRGTSTAGPLTGTLPVTLDNKAVSRYVYIVFYPDGSVNSPTSGPAVTLRKRGTAATAVEFTMVVQSDSGRAKVISN